MSPSLERISERFTQLLGATAVPTGAMPPERAPSAVPATPPAGPTSAVPAPVQCLDHALKGFDLNVTVSPRQVVLAAEILDQEGFGLDTITGVDWLAQGEMEIVYDFFHPTESLHVVIRARVPRAEPELPTISSVLPGANWHERETHDFFGIRFLGHPNLAPFILPEDATFHPLRKDYQP
jgi:NADH-quinone oxidoreductase subunit C